MKRQRPHPARPAQNVRLGADTDRRPEVPRCLYLLPAPAEGGDFEVCITPKMHVALFGSLCRPRGRKGKRCPVWRLGCGHFGCAFPTKEDDKIVKFTTDESDIAGLRAAQGLRYAPTLYGAFKAVARFTRRPKPFVVHGVVVERLQTVPERDQSVIGDNITCALRYAPGVPLPRDPEMRIQPWEVERAVQPENIRFDPVKKPHLFAGQVTFAQKKCCGIAGKPSCTTLVRDILEARHRLAIRGIRWWDVHAGNVGWSKKDQRWKALDLGATSRLLSQDLPRLGGSRRR